MRTHALLPLIILLFCVVPLYALAPVDMNAWPGNAHWVGSGTDRLGSASSTGDFNGDGRWDLAFSAPSARNRAGEVYLYFGFPGFLDSMMYSDPAATADVVVVGEATFQLGKTLLLGDVNGDGLEDLLIGSPRAGDAGEVWIVFGSSSPPSEITEPDVRIIGAGFEDGCGTGLGTSLLNPSDEIQDLIIGSPGADPLERNNAGRVDVLYGSFSDWPSVINLSTYHSDVTLYGATTNNRLGSAVSIAVSFQGELLGNNINSDGWGDLIVGAPGQTYSGRTGSGVVHVFMTGESLVDTVDLSQPNQLEGYRYVGGAFAANETGRSIVSYQAGLLDRLLIGAPAGYEQPTRPGIIYQLTLSELESAPTFIDLRTVGRYRLRILGQADGDSLGANLAAVNGCYLFAAPGRDYRERIRSGSVYHVSDLTPYTGSMYISEFPSNVMTFYGPASSGELGREMAIADFDEDERWDIVFGSQEINTSAGALYAARGGIPFAYAFNPAPLQRAVPTDAAVEFSATDLDEGIDPDEFYINIDGIEYSPGHPAVYYESQNDVYRFSIQPENPFEIDVPISVLFQLVDLGGTRSPVYSYQFETGTDDQAPIVVNEDPQPDEIGVAVTRNVIFDLIDAGAGVDLESIRVTVDGIQAVPGAEILTITGDPSDYLVEYDPRELFTPNSEIEVEIRASDLAEPPNVMTPVRYSFYTSADTTAPELFEILPLDGATISVATNIEFSIIDDNAGVARDSTTLILTQAGEPYPVSLDWDAIPGGYRYTYTPNEQLYEPGQLLLEISAEDRADPPNVMIPVNLTYTVIEDLEAPELVYAEPAPDSVGAARTSTIHLEILDNAAGVDSTSIVLTVDNEEINHNRIGFVRLEHLGYSLELPKTNGTYGESVVVNLTARDRTQEGWQLDTTYTFYTESDTVGPEFLLIDPSPWSEGVSIRDSLVWEVIDSLTGIDLTSLLVVVDDENMNDLIHISANTTINGAEARITLQAVNPYEYEDTLEVRISIDDREEPPNNTTLTYELYTEPDEEAPYLADRTPFPDQAGISRNADIVFKILDDGVGVARDSIRLQIDGIPVEFDELYIQPVESGFAVSYNPPGLFGHEDTVVVRIRGYDLAAIPNLLDEEYSFITLSDDHEPPYVMNMDPADQTEELGREFILSFDVLDDGTGVDLANTTVVRTDGLSWDVEQQVEEIVGGYTFICTPRSEYLWTDTISIEISTQDLADPPNRPELPYRYSFYVEKDNDPPVFADIFPQPDSSITMNRWLEVDYLDLKSGIDTTTVRLTVDGENVNEFTIRTRIPEGYHLRYKPAEEWVENTTVEVTFQASDLSRGNNFALYSYTFDVEPDVSSPFVVESTLYPAPNDTGITEEDTLLIEIDDIGVGVDASRLRLFLFNRSFGDFAQPEAMTDDSLGYRFKLPLADVGLFPGQWVEVRVNAYDRAENSNVMDELRYRFRMAPEETELSVVPTTITPNGDGVWDEALIYHQGESSTSIDLFDMRGRKVATITGNPASWNGTDDNGEPVPGGLYIFQIEGGGTNSQGTIAVAR